MVVPQQLLWGQSLLLLLQVAAAQGPAAWLRCENGTGAMAVGVGADHWSLRLAFAGAGTTTSSWEATPTADGGCTLATTVAGSYRLLRRAQPKPGGEIVVTETFTNLRPADIALWFEVNITAQAEPPGCVLRQWNSHVTELGSTCIDVGGRYNLSHSASFGWMKFYDGHGTGQHHRLQLTACQ